MSLAVAGDAFLVSPAQVAACLATAASQQHVREIAPNDSPEIRAYQRLTGNAPPDAWCMSFVCWVLWTTLGEPLFRHSLTLTGGCEVQRQYVRAHHPALLLPVGTLPRPLDIGLLMDARGGPYPYRAHHTFLVGADPVGEDQYFDTWEGNTNPAGGREGYGVFPRTRRLRNTTLHYTFIRLPCSVLPSL